MPKKGETPNRGKNAKKGEKRQKVGEMPKRGKNAEKGEKPQKGGEAPKRGRNAKKGGGGGSATNYYNIDNNFAMLHIFCDNWLALCLDSVRSIGHVSRSWPMSCHSPSADHATLETNTRGILCTAVHVRISGLILATLIYLSIHWCPRGRQSCQVIDRKRKGEKNIKTETENERITWTAEHRTCKTLDYKTRLRFTRIVVLKTKIKILDLYCKANLAHLFLIQNSIRNYWNIIWGRGGGVLFNVP